MPIYGIADLVEILIIRLVLQMPVYVDPVALGAVARALRMVIHEIKDIRVLVQDIVKHERFRLVKGRITGVLRAGFIRIGTVLVPDTVRHHNLRMRTRARRNGIVANDRVVFRNGNPIAACAFLKAVATRHKGNKGHLFRFVVAAYVYKIGVPIGLLVDTAGRQARNDHKLNVVAQIIQDGAALPVVQDIVYQVVNACDRAQLVRLSTRIDHQLGDILRARISLFLRRVEGVGVYVLRLAGGEVYAGGVLFGVYPVVDILNILRTLAHDLTAYVAAREGDVHRILDLLRDIGVPFLGIVAGGRHAARLGDQITKAGHGIKGGHIGCVIGRKTEGVFFIQRSAKPRIPGRDGNVTENDVSCVGAIVIYPVHTVGENAERGKGDHR